MIFFALDTNFFLILEKSSFLSFMVPIMEHLCHRYPLICSVCQWIINKRNTNPLMEQELPTLPEHPSSSVVFIGVGVDQSLAYLKKSSHLKSLGQMNQNLVGSILGRSSIKIAHLVPIVNKHGHHRPFLFLIG